MAGFALLYPPYVLGYAPSYAKGRKEPKAKSAKLTARLPLLR